MFARLPDMMAWPRWNDRACDGSGVGNVLKSGLDVQEWQIQLCSVHPGTLVNLLNTWMRLATMVARSYHLDLVAAAHEMSIEIFVSSLS
jgi:hypothetical protein